MKTFKRIFDDMYVFIDDFFNSSHCRHAYKEGKEKMLIIFVCSVFKVFTILKEFQNLIKD